MGRLESGPATKGQAEAGGDVSGVAHVVISLGRPGGTALGTSAGTPGAWSFCTSPCACLFSCIVLVEAENAQPPGAVVTAGRVW